MRDPSKELPLWWFSLAKGDIAGFDSWRQAVSLDNAKISGLPEFAELGAKAAAEGKSKEPVSLFSSGHFGCRVPELLEADSIGNEPEDIVRLPERSLPEEAVALLAQFPRSQFAAHLSRLFGCLFRRTRSGQNPSREV